jgi:hypothetical protein
MSKTPVSKSSNPHNQYPIAPASPLYRIIEIVVRAMVSDAASTDREDFAMKKKAENRTPRQNSR